ncbi:hypothetical protein H9Q73_000488 [Fusarium xylarioides]|nr:hypothetical protein H9Q73_000488 [Fusarium xylarioides]
MSNALLEVPAARWLIPAATIVSIAVVFFLPTIKRHIALERLSLVGKGKWDSKTRLVKYLTSCEQVYDEGYRQLPTVFVGPKYLKELSKMPESSFSSLSAFQELMMVKYTKVEATAPVIIHTVKSRLTPSLAKLSGYLGDEVRRALTDELPDCSDWTDVHLSEKLIRVVSRVSGRVFVGANVCRSEEYIDHTINYTRDVMLGAHAVGQVKQWLRPLRAPSLPEIRQLDRRRKQAADFFMPIVCERIERPKQEKPEDLLQWLIDMQAAKYGDTSTSELAKKQLDISFAAIHTTNAVALNTIYTLAAMPRVQAEIREEVRTVLAENKGGSEFSAVQKMKKLDSFIRESVRCYPIGAGKYPESINAISLMLTFS